MAETNVSKVVCERVLEQDENGCLLIQNHPRRVGTDTRTSKEDKDTRAQIRYNIRIKTLGEVAQQVFNALGLSYFIVETAKRLGIYDGKPWTKLSEAEQLSYNGKTVEVDLNDFAAYLEKAAKGERNVVREPEFASVAGQIRAAKLAAAKTATDDATRAMLEEDAKLFNRAYVKGIFTGTIECDADRAKVIKKMVEKFRKEQDNLSNV